jgi:hypothetical protein
MNELVLERKSPFIRPTPYIIAPTMSSVSKEVLPPGESLQPLDWLSKRHAAMQSGQSTQQLQDEGIAKAEHTKREKLDYIRECEGDIVTFGKSGIHGWGLFSRRLIAEGEAVTEFRGEVVSAAEADQREADHEAKGRDCYMLKADTDAVIDATYAGCYGASSITRVIPTYSLGVSVLKASRAAVSYSLPACQYSHSPSSHSTTALKARKTRFHAYAALTDAEGTCVNVMSM